MALRQAHRSHGISERAHTPTNTKSLAPMLFLELNYCTSFQLHTSSPLTLLSPMLYLLQETIITIRYVATIL